MAGRSSPITAKISRRSSINTGGKAEHPDVIVSEQLPVGELLRRASRLLNTITADELSNSYRDLAEFAAR